MGEFFLPVEFAENMCCEIRDIKALLKREERISCAALRSSTEGRWEFMLCMAECHEFFEHNESAACINPINAESQALNRHGLSYKQCKGLISRAELCHNLGFVLISETEQRALPVKGLSLFMP
jgi:hypothetical protein